MHGNNRVFLLKLIMSKDLNWSRTSAHDGVQNDINLSNQCQISTSLVIGFQAQLNR